jgi:hypothetical protein
MGKDYSTSVTGVIPWLPSTLLVTITERREPSDRRMPS